MSHASERPSQTLGLLSTGQHACPYLDDRTACTQFVDPRAPLGPATYEALLQRGFRRSGPHIYRPACPGCAECRSLRLDVNVFTPRRRHRRCIRDHAAWDVRARAPVLTDEQQALFQRYLADRHPGGGMGDGDPEMFFRAPWCETLFYEFRDGRGGPLRAVTIADVLPNALSAVYTFFDPACARRSPGTLGILWQVSEARRMGLRHVYLGYWIESSPAMAYKADFRPHEIHCPPGSGRFPGPGGQPPASGPVPAGPPAPGPSDQWVWVGRPE